MWWIKLWNSKFMACLLNLLNLSLKYPQGLIINSLFFREFQPMMFASDDSLSSDQDTNKFLF